MATVKTTPPSRVVTSSGVPAPPLTRERAGDDNESCPHHRSIVNFKSKAKVKVRKVLVTSLSSAFLSRKSDCTSSATPRCFLFPPQCRHRASFLVAWPAIVIFIPSYWPRSSCFFLLFLLFFRRVSGSAIIDFLARFRFLLFVRELSASKWISGERASEVHL